MLKDLLDGLKKGKNSAIFCSFQSAMKLMNGNNEKEGSVNHEATQKCPQSDDDSKIEQHCSTC